MRKQRGITLVALVVTIVVLIILAGISISLLLGDNGIITKAKEAKKIQIISEAKEKIATEIITAQIEATERNEKIEQAQISDIISKYGELQADGDTIILKDSNEKVNLSDIYKGDIANTGSYSELKAQNELLKQQLEDASKSQSEANKELSELKEVLSQTTATSDKILKDYTAYKDGKLIVGTIENRGNQSDWIPTTSETKVYEAGYYPSSWTVSTNNAYNEGVNNSTGKIIFSQTNGNGSSRYNPYIDLNYFQYISSANTGKYGTIVKVKTLKDCKGYAQIRGVGISSANGTLSLTSTGHTNHTYASNITHAFSFKSGDTLTITAASDNAAIHLMNNIEFSATLVNCGWTTE